MPNPLPPAAAQPRGRHEMTDADTRAIWITIGVIVLSGVVIHFVLAGLFAVLRQLDRPLHIPQTAVPAADAVVPDPQIQGVPPLHPTTPRQDMATYLAEQRRILSSYGPTTQPGYARIPISRAIDLTLSSNMLAGPTTRASQGGTDESR